MLLFRLDASIRVEGSPSRAIADIVEQEWRNARPGDPIILREEAEELARRHGRALSAAFPAALAA